METFKNIWTLITNPPIEVTKALGDLGASVGHCAVSIVQSTVNFGVSVLEILKSGGQPPVG